MHGKACADSVLSRRVEAVDRCGPRSVQPPRRLRRLRPVRQGQLAGGQRQLREKHAAARLGDVGVAGGRDPGHGTVRFLTVAPPVRAGPEGLLKLVTPNAGRTFHRRRCPWLETMIVMTWLVGWRTSDRVRGCDPPGSARKSKTSAAKA